MKFLFFLAFITLFGCITTSKNASINTEHHIYLVRHAEKADDGTKDPPLTDEGEARAKMLAKMLKAKDIKKVYSTDFKRTRNTAAPLSELLGLEMVIYNPRDTSFYNVLRSESKTMNILVVGHSNSTPTLTNAIIGEEKFAKLDESVYDKLFHVSVKNGKYEGTVGSLEGLN